MARHAVPIEHVSRQLVEIAARPGWTVAVSWCDGDDRGAAIVKQGVVLWPSAYRADCYDHVGLVRPEHPATAVESCRTPWIVEVFDAIGVVASPDTCFRSLGDHLGR